MSLCQSRYERFSLCRPPKKNERYGSSEPVLRRIVFEIRLATNLNEDIQVSGGVWPPHAEGRTREKKEVRFQ